MIIETLKTLFNKDLQKLKKEIESYSDEKNMWQIEKAIANSGGNLCLHLLGNLNAYIGVGLAGSNYQRHRDLEFSLKDIPKEELLQRIEATILVVNGGLNNLKENQLQNDFPIVIWDNKPATVEYTLILLATHLNYHLGQINYHRRLLDQP